MSGDGWREGVIPAVQSRPPLRRVEPRVLGQRSPEPVHSISIWRPSRQNRPVRPLSIRAHVSKTLRLAGLPQRCLPNFLPPAFRRSSRDKKARPRSEEHTSETPVTNAHLVCRLLLAKKNIQHIIIRDILH